LLKIARVVSRVLRQVTGDVHQVYTWLTVGLITRSGTRYTSE